MNGYIRGDLLNIGSSSAPTNPGTSGGGSNTSSGTAVAQVRTYASPYADIRATLQNGSKVNILGDVVGEDGKKWTKISFTQDGNLIKGYIPSSYLK